MPTFAYQASDAAGRDVAGSVEAPDRASAVRQLTGRGLQPFQVKEGPAKPLVRGVGKAPAAGAATAKGGKGKTAAAVAAEEASSGPIKIGGKQLQLFTEELAELLEAGMRLEQALKLMEGKGTGGTHSRIAARLGGLIREGHPFSSALKQASPSFNELYCAVAAAGEAGGSLSESMKRQGMYLAKVRELKSQVAVAMIYPSFLGFSAIAVTILFTTFLIPRLSGMMTKMRGGVPKGVQLILDFSAFLRGYWWLLLAGIALIGLLFWVWSNSKQGRPVWDRTKLRIPFFGNVLMANFHTQFLETLASLTGGGLPLLKGLELASRISANLFIQKQLGSVIDGVRDGSALSRSLEKTALFPINLLEMVRIGEHTGDISGTLRRAADRCGRELEKSLEKLMAMLQPMIILVMAGLVGVMAYMMITIIYDTVATLNSRR
ncbi:type II secretion system F family protein [Brevifollis gellanilyticus]|uniref:Type II secretion system protein GspF n=1 Tax=Brevifollis gellanilyticus TaxID=748831 RepID=A0A512MAC1_9BACT|nr:type II secretion system F family protein [Brevifollis gellanilyticus]GEP43680.1 type II secretion system protein GspF [Brevifollis gellanilyticus]